MRLGDENAFAVKVYGTYLEKMGVPLLKMGVAPVIK